LIIVSVLARTSERGRVVITSNFLCGEGMNVFWNDLILNISIRVPSNAKTVQVK
jgi:hypothetical protein